MKVLPKKLSLSLRQVNFIREFLWTSDGIGQGRMATNVKRPMYVKQKYLTIKVIDICMYIVDIYLTKQSHPLCPRRKIMKNKNTSQLFYLCHEFRKAS